MKDLNLTEVFCEILSGLSFFVFLLVPILDIASVMHLREIYKLLIASLSLSLVTGIVVVSYLTGLIVDAIGFCIGESRLCRFVETASRPTEVEMINFWKNVTEHVLSYQDRQWAYFSCYRNLFILGVPGGVLWGIALWREYSLRWLFITLLIAALFELVLFSAMRGLLEIYQRVTKTVGSP